MWKHTHLTELKKIIGLVILMGINKRPNLQSYWSTDEYLQSPIFKQIMPYRRFRYLLSLYALQIRMKIIIK